MITYYSIILFVEGNFKSQQFHNLTDTVDMYQHGHGTVLLFLLKIIAYSEVDCKCEIDSFSELQIPGESTEW